VVIYFIFVQYMKHKMQLMHERSEFDFMTNSANFMQQMTFPLLEGDSSVCN